jgi:glucose/arabinose dehydrogenase
MAALLAVTLAATTGGAHAQPASPRIVQTEHASVEVAEFARGLENPWSLAFLPDGRMLVTERPGRLRIVEPDGTLSAPVAGVPAVQTGGQSGLFEVLPSPGFVRDRAVFLSYAEPGPRAGARRWRARCSTAARCATCG